MYMYSQSPLIKASNPRFEKSELSKVLIKRLHSYRKYEAKSSESWSELTEIRIIRVPINEPWLYM